MAAPTPILLPLRLRDIDVPPPDPPRFDAWYLPSAEAANWVEECAAWPGPQEELRFFPVDGAVVVLLQNGALPETPPARGFGLHLVLDRILLPENTGLSPALTREEANALIPGDLGLLLPPDRWFSFDIAGGIPFHELLAPIPGTETEWNHAVPPPDPLPPLAGIAKVSVPDIEEEMDRWGNGIGTEDPSQIREPGDGKRGEGKGPRTRLLEGILRFTRSVPEREGIQPTWVNRLEKWAAGHLSELTRKQSRELDRLIDLMKRDPDQGLRFALPLTGNAGRGTAPPGDVLSRRNIDFNLGNLFGSGLPVSPWMLDSGHYESLLSAYREAANREIRLGRFRRAAYIFAELLGDMQAAANALEQGRFFAEAATIYEKKLHAPDAAATAYRKAGRFEEALRLYRELERHEDVARLLRDLGREGEAEDAFRFAAAFYLDRDQRVDAGRIAREDLGDDAFALEIYREAWPGSPDAARCLELETDLLARRGEHDRVERRLRSLAGGEWPDRESRVLIGHLTQAHRDYPNDGVRATAGDLARVIAGERLSRSPSQAGGVLSLVPEFDPSDRLLRRDARRFAGQARRNPSPDPASPGAGPDHDLRVIETDRRSPQPPGTRPVAACGIDGHTALASLSLDRLHVTLSHRETGTRASYSRDCRAPHGLIFRLLPMRSLRESGDCCLVVQDSRGRFAFPFERMTSGDGILVGNSPLFRQTLGMVSTQGGLTWKLHAGENGEVYLEATIGGRLVETRHLASVPENWLPGEVPFVPMTVSQGQVFFGIGHRLCRWEKGRLGVLDLPYPIIDLATAPLSSPLRIAVAMEHGFAAVRHAENWEDPPGPFHEVIHETLARPRLLLTETHHLVAAGDEGIAVYSISAHSISRRGEFPSGKDIPVLAVIARDHPREFEVVTREGIIGYRFENR